MCPRNYGKADTALRLFKKRRCPLFWFAMQIFFNIFRQITPMLADFDGSDFAGFGKSVKSGKRNFEVTANFLGSHDFGGTIRWLFIVVKLLMRIVLPMNHSFCYRC